MPNRVAIEPEQLPSLLEAAGVHRPLVATMAGAGLRNGEACALDWREIDLGAGTISVSASKTDTGIRVVDFPAACARSCAALREFESALAWAAR